MGMLKKATTKDWITGFAPTDKKTMQRHVQNNRDTYQVEHPDQKKYRDVNFNNMKAPSVKANDVKKRTGGSGISSLSRGSLLG